MLPVFQDNFILIEATSSHFFRVTTSKQQLLFCGSYFFRTAAVLSFFTFSDSHFFAGVIFSEQLLFRSENSTKQPLLENRKFFTAVTFWNSCFFSEELFKIKISKKSYFFKAGTSAQHQKSYIFQKINFHITYFFRRTVFSEQLLFRKTLPSIAATFSEELLFYNILFQKSYYFTATVPFHSYTTYLFVSN